MVYVRRVASASQRNRIHWPRSCVSAHLNGQWQHTPDIITFNFHLNASILTRFKDCSRQHYSCRRVASMVSLENIFRHFVKAKHIYTLYIYLYIYVYKQLSHPLTKHFLFSSLLAFILFRLRPVNGVRSSVLRHSKWHIPAVPHVFLLFFFSFHQFPVVYDKKETNDFIGCLICNAIMCK